MKIPVVKKDSTLNLSFDYEEYIQLKAISIDKTSALTPEDLQLILDKVNNGEPLENMDHAITFVLAHIVGKLEQYAIDNNLIEEIDQPTA